jgi:ribosomal 30S subunit maturation factor RimM
MSTAILWLILLLILTIIIIFYIKYTNDIPSIKREGFTVKTCPSNTTSYITHDGFTNCCSGEVIDNHCEKILCSLSPGSPVTSCTTYGLNLIARNDANYCNPEFTGDCSMYFTNSEGTVRGCSKSNLNPSRTGPSDLSQPYCRLYDTADANTRNYDSCQNYLARFNAVAGLATCNEELARVRTSIPAPAASAASTDYVIYGDGITGNLPVTKIINVPAARGDPPAHIFLAQDGSVVRLLETDIGYTKNAGSSYFTGNLSDITDFGSLNRIAGSGAGTTRAKYNIKKSDGSGILTPAPTAPVNPTGYVIYGPGISGELPVAKIINSPEAFSKKTKIYLSQDGTIVRAIVVDKEYTELEHSLYFNGNVNNINDYNTYISYVAGNVDGIMAVKGIYNIKKADGSGILLNKSHVIYGEGISGELPVEKTIDSPEGAINKTVIYLSQDKSIVRAVTVNKAYTEIEQSVYFTGQVNDINNYNRYGSYAAGNMNGIMAVGAKYNIKKADGSAILLNKK